MIWALASAALAVGMEWWFRSHGTWQLWAIFPAVAVNYCIYRLVTGSASLISGIILFTAVSVAMRIGVSILLGEFKDAQDYVRAVVLIALSLWR